MGVEREKPQAMIDDDGVAVDAEIADEGDDAAVGGFGGIVLGDGQVVAEVIGVVDRFVVVDVGPRVGEVGFDLGVAELAEGAFPEHRGRCFIGDRSDFRLRSLS